MQTRTDPLQSKTILQLDRFEAYLTHILPYPLERLLALRVDRNNPFKVISNQQKPHTRPIHPIMAIGTHCANTREYNA